MIFRYGAAISFVFKEQRRARDGIYVSEAATQKTGGKASRIGESLFNGL